MDHSISASLAALIEAAAHELKDVHPPVAQQHVIYDLLAQAGIKALVVVLPDPMPEAEASALYRVNQAALAAFKEGVSALAVIGQRETGHRFVGVKRLDAERADFRDDIMISPDGCTYKSGTLGPFDLHLPTWVPASMAGEITGIMWRVLRFCLSGYGDALRYDINDAAYAALRKNGMEKYAAQYVAMGFMRWLLSRAGVRTYDVFGNEVLDTMDYFYGELFAQPEHMPSEYARRAASVEAGLRAEADV